MIQIETHVCHLASSSTVISGVSDAKPSLEELEGKTRTREIHASFFFTSLWLKMTADSHQNLCQVQLHGCVLIKDHTFVDKFLLSAPTPPTYQERSFRTISSDPTMVRTACSYLLI